MRNSLWFSCYLMTGAAIVVQYVREAYTRAADVCEMYPSFPFGETLREELWDHTTLLPIVHRPIATLTLLVLYALAYVVTHFNLVELAWLLLAEILSGRWIHHALFVVIPSYLPFLAAEPGVPELLSDGEEDENDAAFRNEFGYEDDDSAAPRPPVNATECHRALEKLVQVKLQFADREIERPDDWLVFDPQEGLVLQKKKMQKRDAEQVDDSLLAVNGNGTSGASRKSEEDPTIAAEQPCSVQKQKHLDAPVGIESHHQQQGIRQR